MNVKKFLCVFILISASVLPLVIVVSPCDQVSFENLRSASDRGVSGYEIARSVTYQVDVNFSFTYQSGALGLYFFKFARLNDRQPNSELTQYCAPYQESELQYNSIIGSEKIPFLYRDRFNNTYDVFNATDLLIGESITLNQKYKVKLNEVFFNSIDPSEIGEYDTSDEIFFLYCINSEKYYERHDFNINATSYSIVNPDDNPIVKAQKICNWVADHLEYETVSGGEMGAKWAYDNKMGDCSEYSSLMITLLRCQGIPARKVTGPLITKDIYTEPYIGQEWSFIYSPYGQRNLTNHAWVEYYVPNVGWIACDPTWDDTKEYFNPLDYFNRIDFFRLNLNVGAWFSVPLFSDESEFCNPCIIALGDISSQNATIIDFEYGLRVKVVDTNFGGPETPIEVVLSVVLVFDIIGISVLLINYAKKKLKNLMSQNLFQKNEK